MTLEEVTTLKEAIKRLKEVIKEVRSTIQPFLYDNEAKDYILKALEQEPCEDCISRQAVMDALCNDCELFRNGEQTCFTKCEEFHFLATLPPVNPQEPKTGRWIDDKCSACGKGIEDLIASPEWYRDEEPKFCPFCGIKLVNPQESEDKE